MATWIQYYKAATYCPALSALDLSELEDANEGVDQVVGALLGISTQDMITVGLGTSWMRVQSLFLDPQLQWFAHGDPWTVLLGLGPGQVTVSGLDLTTDMMSGPGALTMAEPSAALVPDDTFAVVSAIDAVRASMAEQWQNCKLCSSPRLGAWCTCDGAATGRAYD